MYTQLTMDQPTTDFSAEPSDGETLSTLSSDTDGSDSEYHAKGSSSNSNGTSSSDDGDSDSSQSSRRSSDSSDGDYNGCCDRLRCRFNDSSDDSDCDSDSDRISTSPFEDAPDDVCGSSCSDSVGEIQSRYSQSYDGDVSDQEDTPKAKRQRTDYE